MRRAFSKRGLTDTWSRAVIGACALVWFTGTLGGSVVIYRYKTRPGPQLHAARPRWPLGEELPLSRDKATLVMIVHPQCACTRASIAELARIMSRVSDKVSAHALFHTLPTDSEAWSHSDTWRAAARIPSVSVREDLGGELATRLGAATSGHVYLYSRAGRLLFSGGITSSRGHEGGSRGQAQIYAALARDDSLAQTASVYGCELTDGAQSGAWTDDDKR